MKLSFFGHHETYAVEQTLLTLFPNERPEYSEEPSGTGNELELRYSEGRQLETASATLRYAGKIHRALTRAKRLPEGASEVSATRQRRRLLQRAFYRAAVDALGVEPPWGMLSGVRPVKLPVRAVLQGQSLAQAERTLLKTYRVSPSRTALAMDCARAALSVQRSLRENQVALYLGIPFCPTRCAYCSFISAAGNTNQLIPAYLEALHQEICITGAAARRAGLFVRSVYLGGGTPTTLTAEQMAALLSAVRAEFPLCDGAEFTVEAGRPDTITREKLDAMRQHGVNRVSINPQSLSDEVLSAIGRAHSVAEFFSAWELVQAVGFPCVNMDLIAGLPADTLEGFEKSIDGVLALHPENITVHTLALKRGSRLHAEGGTIPDEACVAAMLDYAWEKLRKAGYLPYYLYRQKYMSGGFENLGWCKPGFEGDYNICMMEELCSILSLGAGAVSKRIDYAAGSLSRQTNPKYPQEYLRDLPRILTEKQAFASNLYNIDNMMYSKEEERYGIPTA